MNSLVQGLNSSVYHFQHHHSSTFNFDVINSSFYHFRDYHPKNTVVFNILNNNTQNITDSGLREIRNNLRYHILPILLFIIAGIGIIGNGLVILVIGLNKKMRSVTNIMILNLALNELFYSGIFLPIDAVDWWKYNETGTIFGDFSCRLYCYTANVCELIRVLTLVFISLDRYMAVVHPMSNLSIRLRTQKIAITLMLVLWFVTLTTCVYRFFIATLMFNENTNYFVCAYTDTITQNISVLSRSMASFYLPLLLIFTVYIRILYKLFTEIISTQDQLNTDQGIKHVTKTIVIVVVAHYACVLPSQILRILEVSQ